MTNFNLFYDYELKNKHIFSFLGILLLAWLIYWNFIIAKLHYSIQFLLIFGMGFVSCFLLIKMFKIK